MKQRRGVPGAALALLSLPAFVVAASAANFRVNNRDEATIADGAISYTVYIPASYDFTKPAALVLSFHGASLWGRAQQALSGWDDVADREGFIVVYPTAAVGDGPRAWHVAAPQRVLVQSRGYVDNVLPADVHYVSALLDALQSRYNIDAKRIYANGLSNGGGMSWLLSCTLPHRIAAVGLVGAAFTAPMDWCANQSPVPVILLHGTKDEEALYYGGKSWVAPMVFPSIPGVARDWARRNGCAPAYTDSSVAADVVLRSWTSCNGADVQLYTILDGGHTWPGGRHLPRWFAGRTTQSIGASTTMWEFFKRHQLRR